MFDFVEFAFYVCYETINSFFPFYPTPFKQVAKCSKFEAYKSAKRSRSNFTMPEQISSEVLGLKKKTGMKSVEPMSSYRTVRSLFKNCFYLDTTSGSFFFLFHGYLRNSFRATRVFFSGIVMYRSEV